MNVFVKTASMGCPRPVNVDEDAPARTVFGLLAKLQGVRGRLIRPSRGRRLQRVKACALVM
jgi:hypothetical protein